MTIPSQCGEEQRSDEIESCDVFSVMSFGKTDGLTKKVDLDDPEAPAVVREDATPPTCSTVSDTIYTYGEHQDHNDCPLLQGVSVDCLPSRFIDLLDGRGEGPPGVVEFYPGYIPNSPCMNAVIIFILASLFVGVSVVVSKDVSAHGMGVGVGIGCFFAFVLGWILLVGCLVACNDYKTLFAKDSAGNPKPWPGDWKGGVYTTRLALLEFDGRSKVWLFPVDSIEKLEAFQLEHENSKPRIMLWIKEEKFQYELRCPLEDPSKVWEIQRWYKDVTSTRGRNCSENEME